ncbi:MAG: DHH family phosphoesterase, partial [bacterium]
MSKRLSHIRALFMFVEVMILVITAFLYVTLKTNLTLVALIVTISQILIALVFLFTASRVIEDTAISVTDSIDLDMRNALVFGGIALVHYDENRNITWISDLLLAMNINVVGVKLLEWQPTLAGLFESDDVKMIELKGKRFEVYNSADTHLLFLKDVTQYVSLMQDFEDQQMCVAYVTIDNYDEMMENVDEPKMVTMQAKCRQLIVDWAYENGMIIRNYKSGGYLVFFNERIYKKLVEDKFKILDQFKKETSEYDEIMTLSMGIGRETRVLRELEQFASQALALSRSRGGDQVAIKSGKDKIRYYGGATESSEKSSKVRTRVIAQSLGGLIRGAKHVIIMGHKNSDLDSFGASLAMARIVQSYGKEAFVLINRESLEAKTKQVVKSLKGLEEYDEMIVSPGEAINLVHRRALLIVVDHHRPDLSISQVLLDEIKNKVVIDHHRRGEDFIDAPILTYLQPSASSTVELLVELCDYQKVDVNITETDATIMYAGMIVDTSNFRQRVSARTFQSAAKMREYGADVQQAYRILEDSIEDTKEVIDLMKTMRSYHKSTIIAYGEDQVLYNRASLAKSSNQLLDMIGVEAAFTIARVDKNSISVSARSGKTVNVQMIMEELGGGGHFSMAACQFND